MEPMNAALVSIALLYVLFIACALTVLAADALRADSTYPDCPSASMLTTTRYWALGESHEAQPMTIPQYKALCQ